MSTENTDDTEIFSVLSGKQQPTGHTDDPETFSVLSVISGKQQLIRVLRGEKQFHIMQKQLYIILAATMGSEAAGALYDLRWMLVFILWLTAADFWFGISESRKRKIPFRLSRAGRRTCNKLTDYVAYLLTGALLGMALFEPLHIAGHTTTAACGLALGCLWEIDSIVGHVLFLHGLEGRFSLRRFLLSLIKHRNPALGEALEEGAGEGKNEK